MAEAATDQPEGVMLNIADMIDLAIGTPEVGVVDFNMLQTVLHCLAQQIRILDKPVEVHGVSPTTLSREISNVQTVNVTEFAVATDGKEPVQKSRSPPPSDDTILVATRIKKKDSPTRVQAPDAASKGRPSVSAREGSPGADQPGTEGLSLVTYSKFNLLENAVGELQKRVLGSIPKNEDILEEVRSQTNIKAIQDMWQNLNVSARLEAAETGIDKLSSLVQSIIKETAGLQDLVDKMSTLQLAASSARVDDAAATASSAGMDLSAAVSREVMGMRDYVGKLRTDFDNMAQQFYDAMKKMRPDVDLPPPPKSPKLEEEHLTKSDKSSIGRGKKSLSGGADVDIIEILERLSELEKRLEDCQKTLDKGQGGIQDQINSLQDQLEYLSKQIAGFTTGMMTGTLSPDLVKDLQGLMQLFQTVHDMQDQLKQVHDTAVQLATEKDDRKHHINVLLEQIELLKSIKLDREDMAEAMAEKADLRMLARKVSHDQFELACDDLSKGLEHALGKLNMQEALWQQALDDIQREIEAKLDKVELSPVRDFFNSKLKMLQESLKQMASLRREAEAAGTKRKLLRDVNCLSCDANAVMPMEAPPTIPVSKPFPGTMSMKPYLSYELDTIRKTQASNLPQRNMHDWENIDKQMNQPAKQQRVRSGADKHLCNRYCGGSHTTTTAAQRVARLGHFMKQWGPDVIPMSTGMAAGDDGKLYRVSPADGTAVGPGGAVDSTCTPKPPKKPLLPSASEVIAEDCKCMEPPQPAGIAIKAISDS